MEESAARAPSAPVSRAIGTGAAPPGATPAFIVRPRLERRLDGSHEHAISVVSGSAGAGKSELVRGYAESSGAIYFRAGASCGTFARFVHGIAQALAPVAPGALASFPRAWERALQSRAPGTVLAHWLCEHLAGVDRRLVIDDLYDAAADPGIAELIGKLAELRPNAPLTLAVRDIGALPLALWMATGRMDRQIDEDELRFDLAEVAAAAAASGVALEPDGAARLLTATAGAPIAVSYALTRLRDDPDAFATVPIPATFDEIAVQIFGRRTGHERAFLLSASLYPSPSDEVLALSGWDDAAAIRRAIGSDAAFIWEPAAARGFAFYDRFTDFLAREFAARDHEMRATIARRAVGSLRIAGRYADALEVATRQRQREAMGELLDAHGFEILESGEIGVIAEALTVLDDPQAALGASALALRGYLEARADRGDTAEAWFSLALDRAGDEEVKVAIAMYYARELALRRRPDAYEVLEPFAASTTLPRSLLIDVRSSYAQALTAAGRLDEAAARTNEALELLEPQSPPALRARVFARGAYVALECGDTALARERARIAAPLAVAQSLYDVAASTYSVLYNIAYDVDDDAAASLEYLRRVRDLGVKSGTLRLDLYALLGMYELCAETGDTALLRDLEREIAAVDKHDATAAIMEGLVPARALQAGWDGRFADAARLLRPTAAHQPTPARKALCWAQIALYSAAARLDDEADAALMKAEQALDGSACPAIKTGLTLLALGFASWVRGDSAGARARLAAAGDETIGTAPRLRALRGALAALVDAGVLGSGYSPAVAAALEELRRASFGGMARLIEALPLPFAPDRRAQTLGSLVAAHELPAYFAAAAAADDAAVLHAWLGARPAAFADWPKLNERFERWAAQQGRTASPRALAHLRRQLARYRHADPPVLALVDDIDDAIETLFHGLEIAAPLMGEHSRAVSAWCSRLARLLGLTDEEILFVTRAGLIHDIGKMRTPSDILNAPRRLRADEWAIMADHAAEGGRIVSEHPILRPFRPIVHGHHERIDGKGYPDGLRLSAIPLAARIVSVADSFNAMIGRRSYRLPVPPSEALTELERHRGTQFDPEVVEAMVRVVAGSVAESGIRPDPLVQKVP